MKVEMVITRNDGTVVTADFTETGHGIGGEKYSYYDLLVKVVTGQTLDERDQEEIEYIKYAYQKVLDDYKKAVKKNEGKTD